MRDSDPQAPGFRHLVELSPDHPGFKDPEYRRRRDEIARVAQAHLPGSRVPGVDYTETEHATWHRVCGALAPLHARLACQQVIEAQRGFALPLEVIPQFEELNPRLLSATGFRLEPVAGLIAGREFLEQLGDSTFLATQYVRHTARPFYTPEPDVLHELVGHAAGLADPRIAELSRAFGRAARATDAAGALQLERVYWRTLEFGVVAEPDRVTAFGAGILSSVDELHRLEAGKDLVAWDLDRMAGEPYDPTSLQPQYFVARSFDDMVADLGAWLAGF